MIKNPLAGFDFRKPFETKKSKNLFGYHTTPREFKHGARDIPFGMGAKSLYVDGTNGHDSNDGESWKTPTKTIQEAIGMADHWTTIFIKPGAYAEAAQVDSKHGISLIGATRAGVHITAPDGGNAYTSSAVSFKDALSGYVANLKLTSGNLYYGVYAANSDMLRVENCYGHTCHIGVNLYNSDDAIIYNNLINGNNPSGGVESGIYIAANSSRCHVLQNTILNYTGAGSGARILGEECRFHDNTITTVYYGIYVLSDVAVTTIFHNNLITCSSAYIRDDSTNATVFENFYSAHTNVDNGFGIATEPYAFTGGTDLRPVVVRNGWNSVSILRTLLRKKTAAQTTQAATDANGTAWVDMKTLTPTTTDLELHRLKMTAAGTWAGTPTYRITVGATKVYPFSDDKSINSGLLETLIFPINVQIGETAKIQFRSTNAADGAGETVALTQLDYTTVL